MIIDYLSLQHIFSKYITINEERKKIQTLEKITVLVLKFKQVWFYHRVMCPKDADGMTNSVDPDQTAPSGGDCLPRNVCVKPYGHYSSFCYHFRKNKIETTIGVEPPPSTSASTPSPPSTPSHPSPPTTLPRNPPATLPMANGLAQKTQNQDGEKFGSLARRKRETSPGDSSESSATQSPTAEVNLKGKPCHRYIKANVLLEC